MQFGETPELAMRNKYSSELQTSRPNVALFSRQNPGSIVTFDMIAASPGQVIPQENARFHMGRRLPTIS